jgi:hypothetical protein
MQSINIIYHVLPRHLLNMSPLWKSIGKKKNKMEVLWSKENIFGKVGSWKYSNNVGWRPGMLECQMFVMSIAVIEEVISTSGSR